MWSIRCIRGRRSGMGRRRRTGIHLIFTRRSLFRLRRRSGKRERRRSERIWSRRGRRSLRRRRIGRVRFCRQNGRSGRPGIRNRLTRARSWKEKMRLNNCGSRGKGFKSCWIARGRSSVRRTVMLPSAV